MYAQKKNGFVIVPVEIYDDDEDYYLGDEEQRDIDYVSNVIPEYLDKLGIPSNGCIVENVVGYETCVECEIPIIKRTIVKANNMTIDTEEKFKLPITVYNSSEEMPTSDGIPLDEVFHRLRNTNSFLNNLFQNTKLGINTNNIDRVGLIIEAKQF